MTAPPAAEENRAHLPQFPRRPPANLDRAEYGGDFYSPELDILYNIRAKDGGLYLEQLGNTALPLSWRAPDEFAASGFVFNFRRAGGRITGFTLGAGRVRNIAFEKRGV